MSTGYESCSCISGSITPLRVWEPRVFTGKENSTWKWWKKNQMEEKVLKVWVPIWIALSQFQALNYYSYYVSNNAMSQQTVCTHNEWKIITWHLKWPIKLSTKTHKKRRKCTEACSHIVPAFNFFVPYKIYFYLSHA